LGATFGCLGHLEVKVTTQELIAFWRKINFLKEFSVNFPRKKNGIDI